MSTRQVCPKRHFSCRSLAIVIYHEAQACDMKCQHGFTIWFMLDQVEYMCMVWKSSSGLSSHANSR